MERWSLRLWGRVQGVNLRWQVREHAEGEGLTGWIMNESGGSVLIEIQGARNSLSGFVSWLETRARWVSIKTMQVNKLTARPENEFVIKT